MDLFEYERMVRGMRDKIIRNSELSEIYKEWDVNNIPATAILARYPDITNKKIIYRNLSSGFSEGDLQKEY